MCAPCVDRLFGSGPSTCPVAGCSARLRANRFRAQTFDDIDVEREVDVRKRVAKIFNKRADEFATQREWDDYLEKVEEMIFSLTNAGNDKDKAEARLLEYEAANKEAIKRNSERERAEKEVWRVRHAAEKEEVRLAREAKARLEEEERAEAVERRRAQIDALASGDHEAVNRVKRVYEKRAEERMRIIEAARGLREGREIAMQTLFANARVVSLEDEDGDGDEYKWEPLGKDGVREKSRYFVPLEGGKDDYGPNDWVDSFVAKAEVDAGGWDRNEWSQKTLFEAFSGLTVFLDEQEESDEIGVRRRTTDLVVIDATAS
jgi:CDK-activating kinase assembly factor MAT1